MDLNRLLQTVVRMFLRKGVNWGIKTATTRASRKPGTPPAGADQSRAARDLAKRARQAARITRRLGR
jgi:hypothetical protein